MDVLQGLLASLLLVEVAVHIARVGHCGGWRG